jgi:ppGpp synthetase/RelA/SpoT-type nucleotidyltranferase
VPLPFTKSQIERLGQRLVASSEPAAADIAALHEVLRAYSVVLDEAAARLREATGLAPTLRVKNTGTILEKLRRHGGSWLKSIQDLAGMRVVGTFDRRGQDEMVRDVVALFSDAPRAPKVVDRRANPVNGYRAVHVIVFPEAVPVEIQVRTELQHAWAELFEKIADLVGRDIRYGEPPAHWLSATERDTLDAEVLEVYGLLYTARKTAVTSALARANTIADVEVVEFAAPHTPELAQFRRAVTIGLSDLRALIEQLEAVEARAAPYLRPHGYA